MITKDFRMIYIRTPSKSVLSCEVSDWSLIAKERLLGELRKVTQAHNTDYSSGNAYLETNHEMTEDEIDELSVSVTQYLTSEGFIELPEDDDG
jgi:hypothetical protein